MAILIENKRLSDHFFLHEMASKGADGPYVKQDISTELFVIAAERFRVWYKRYITPSSWYRTFIHNNNEGGSSISQHLLGTAIDVLFPSNEADSNLLMKLYSERQDEFLANITTAWAWIVYDICEEYKETIELFDVNMNTGVFWYYWGFHIGIGQYDSNRWKDYRYSMKKIIN